MNRQWDMIKSESVKERQWKSKLDKDCLSIRDTCLWASCLLLSVTDLTGPWLHPYIEASKKKKKKNFWHLTLWGQSEDNLWW